MRYKPDYLEFWLRFPAINEILRVTPARDQIGRNVAAFDVIPGSIVRGIPAMLNGERDNFPCMVPSAATQAQYAHGLRFAKTKPGAIGRHMRVSRMSDSNNRLHLIALSS